MKVKDLRAFVSAVVKQAPSKYCGAPLFLDASAGTVTAAVMRGGYFARAQYPCDGKGAACVDAVALAKLLPSKGEAYLSMDGETLTITQGAIVRKASDMGAKAPMREDYPNPVAPAGGALASSLWAMTTHCAGESEYRPVLCGIGFNKGTLLATDGHRMLVRPCDNPGCGDGAVASLPWLRLIRAAEPDARISVKGDRFVATDPHGGTCGTVTSEYTPPPFEMVCRARDQDEATCTVGREYLLQIVGEAIKAYAGESRPPYLVLQLSNGEIEITAKPTDQPEVVLRTEAVISKGTVMIGFNGKLLAECLDSLEGDLVDFGFSGDKDPIMMYGEAGDLAVCMPIRM